MAVNLTEKRADELLEIDGIRLFTGRAGIKQQDRDDLTLMVLGGGHTVGAVFTQNRFCAAPVHIAKSHLFDPRRCVCLSHQYGQCQCGYRRTRPVGRD